MLYNFIFLQEKDLIYHLEVFHVKCQALFPEKIRNISFVIC